MKIVALFLKQRGGAVAVAGRNEVAAKCRPATGRPRSPSTRDAHEALGGQTLIGFDFGTARRPEREFVAL